MTSAGLSESETYSPPAPQLHIPTPAAPAAAKQAQQESPKAQQVSAKAAAPTVAHQEKPEAAVTSSAAKKEEWSSLRCTAVDLLAAVFMAVFLFALAFGSCRNPGGASGGAAGTEEDLARSVLSASADAKVVLSAREGDVLTASRKGKVAGYGGIVLDDTDGL